MSEHTYFLLYLNQATFAGAVGEQLAAELRYVMCELKHDMDDRHVDCRLRIVMVHERAPEAGGCDFDRFLVVTPKELVNAGLYKVIATSLYPGEHASISYAEVFKTMGLKSHKRAPKSALQGMIAGLPKRDRKDPMAETSRGSL